MKMKVMLGLVASGIGCMAQAMDFAMLGKPASITVDGRAAGDRVALAADGTVTLKGGTASWVRLSWPVRLGAATRVLGGMWERTYGDSAWYRVDDAKSPRKGCLAWYFLATDGVRTDGYGVKVQPNAFACWKAHPDRIELSLDVRAGSDPVELGARAVALCQLVSRRGEAGESAYQAGRAFCRVMCPVSRLPKEPVYGYNDWYCAYGNNTATNFLADAQFLIDALDAQPGPRPTNRPYVVADDGWQNALRRGGDPTRTGGQWGTHNPHWGMTMDEFARRVKAMGAHPGLWYRPFETDDGKETKVDPTDPIWEKRIREEMTRFVAWGMELVKTDFITWDWNDSWGFGLEESPVQKPLAHWRDRTRTTAEVVKGLYQVMRESAGDRALIIGCNAIDHFAAGLFELQRTGDDTSGKDWSRTRKMGPNTLGMRAIQDGIFYSNDGDCVGLVEEGDVDWSLNRQWLDLVANSGTALFTSWKRRLAQDPAVRQALGAAWKRASERHATAEPLDWLETPRPTRWRLDDGRVLTYDWEVRPPEGAVMWDFPRTGSCHEGLAFSDGITGVLVWGGDETLNLTVGRADLWDHRGGYEWTSGQNYKAICNLVRSGDTATLKGLFRKVTPVGEPRNPYMLPLGRVICTLPKWAQLQRGWLDTKTGLGKLEFTLKNGELRYIDLAMSREHRTFAMRYPQWMGRSIKTTVKPATEFAVYEKSLRPTGFEKAKVRADGFDWNLPADPRVSLTWKCDNDVFALATSRGEANPAPTVDYRAVRRASCAQWAAFWREGARVKLPDARLQRVFDYGMYRFGAMTDPAGVPAGLQGSWLEDDRLVPWNGDYHFNINVQECYSPAFRGGHFAHLKPLFDMILAWRPRLRANAHKFVQIDNGYALPHSVDDRGVCIGGYWLGTIDHASTAWMAALMYRYVRYSGDVAFLREGGYDFMRGAMNVYLAMLEDKDGKLALPLGPSPEWGSGPQDGVGRNPSFQLAAARRLALDLTAAAAQLDEKPDPRWADLLRRLPQYALAEGGIALFEGLALPSTHRHHSHMAGIYPFDTVPRLENENHAVLEATYRRWMECGTGKWTGWCVPWASILHTDAGNAVAAAALLRAWDVYFCNPGHGSLHNAYEPGFTSWTTYGSFAGSGEGQIMQMDGQCAAATAILELLAHDINGKTEFFRGCPAEWKDVSFENLALADGRRVNGRRLNGKITIESTTKGK